MEALDPIRRDLGDVLAGVGVAGDRDHPDLGVPDEVVADGRAGARDDVEDAGREDACGDLAEDQGGQRGAGGGLEDDRVAGGEGRPDLPAGHHDRVVPRRDRGDHADRLAPDHRGEAGRVLVDRLAFHEACATGEEAQVVDDDRDLVDGGANGLAGVLRLEAAELLAARLEGVGELEQHPAPLGGRRVLPGLEGGRGRVGGAIHVLGIRRLDPRDDLAVGRVLDIERLARRGIDPFAADELLVGLDALEDVGHRLGPSGIRSWHGRLVLVLHRTAPGNPVPVSGPGSEWRRIPREGRGSGRGRSGGAHRGRPRRTARSKDR